MEREDQFSQIMQARWREQEAEERQSETEKRNVRAANPSSVVVPPPQAPSALARPMRGRKRVSCKSTCCSPDTVQSKGDVDNMETSERAVESNATALRKVNASSNKTHAPRNVPMSPSHSAKGEDEAGAPVSAKQKPPMNIDRSQFYEVRALSESPDARSRLESAIVHVASALREDPTIPADPQESTLPWGAATGDDVGLVLPTKHCAFRGCLWWNPTIILGPSSCCEIRWWAVAGW